MKQKFELEHEIELDQIKQKGSTGSQVCIFKLIFIKVLSIFKQKKFYTRTRIRVSQLAKIPTLFLDWWRMRSLN